MAKPGKPPIFDGDDRLWPDWKSSIWAHLNVQDLLMPLVQAWPEKGGAARSWDRKRSMIHSQFMLCTSGPAKG
eukprot:40983-Eustigmatos_ZCMA.PRE.1